MSRRYSRCSDRASYSGCPWKKMKWLRNCLAKISTPASGDSGQQLIAPGSEVALAQLVEARMRHLQRRGDILRQPMVGRLGAVIDARAFRAEPLPLDAVEMQHRGMRGEARPDRRTRVGSRPVDDLGEVLPERLFGQRCGVRLGAGDDQPVDLQAIEIGDIGVLPGRYATWPACDRLTDGSEKQCKWMRLLPAAASSRRMNWRSVACSARVRHVVDERRWSAPHPPSARVELIGFARLRGRQRGTDDRPMFVEQERHARPGRSIPRPRAA